MIKNYTIQVGVEIFIEKKPVGATLPYFKRSMIIKYGANIKVREII